MNTRKYFLIFVVALFAVAAISAFGAESRVNISTDTTVLPEPDLSEPIARLNNNSRAVAAVAVKDLALMRTEQATQALISYIKTSKDDYMRIQVIETFAADPSTAAGRALVESVRDRNPYVRNAAIKSLGFRPDAESLPELKRVLSEDIDISDRKFALQALSHHTSAASVETVDNVLADKRNKRELRVMAAHSLKNMNTPAAKNRLEKYNNDTDVAVKNEVSPGRAEDQTKRKKGK